MHHEADKNSMSSCQLIPIHYLTNIKLKRIEQMNGSRMKDKGSCTYYITQKLEIFDHPPPYITLYNISGDHPPNII